MLVVGIDDGFTALSTQTVLTSSYEVWISIWRMKNSKQREETWHQAIAALSVTTDSSAYLVSALYFAWKGFGNPSQNDLIFDNASDRLKTGWLPTPT